MGIVRLPPLSRFMVISAGVLAATAPATRVPSRITTVACGSSATGGASCFAQEARNSTGMNNSFLIKASIAPGTGLLAIANFSNDLPRSFVQVTKQVTKSADNGRSNPFDIHGPVADH